MQTSADDFNRAARGSAQAAPPPPGLCRTHHPSRCTGFFPADVVPSFSKGIPFAALGKSPVGRNVAQTRLHHGRRRWNGGVGRARGLDMQGNAELLGRISQHPGQLAATHNTDGLPGSQRDARQSSRFASAIPAVRAWSVLLGEAAVASKGKANQAEHQHNQE